MKRRELVKALELVQPSLASGLVPIFGCFMFNEGTITGFNGDSLAIKANFDAGLTLAVDGRTLLGLLQNSKADELTIKVEASEIRIKAAKSNFKLPYLKTDDFLFEEPKEKWTATTEITEELLKAIGICLTTTSRDHAYPALMGLSFNFEETTLTTLYSCDGDAVTKYVTEDGYEGEGIYTVPNSFCDALMKIYQETEAVGGKLEMNCNWAKATLSSGFTVYGRIVANDTPLDHAKLIADTMNTEVPFVSLPEGFNEALSRARVIADLENKPTVLTVFDGKLGLLTDSASYGEARDDMPIKGHPDVEAFVHASLVQRSIGICDQISIQENCTAFKQGNAVLQVLSNVGE